MGAVVVVGDHLLLDSSITSNTARLLHEYNHNAPPFLFLFFLFMMNFIFVSRDKQQQQNACLNYFGTARALEPAA